MHFCLYDSVTQKNRLSRRKPTEIQRNVKSVFSDPTPDELEPPVTETDRPYPDVDELRITSDDVQKLLENLNPNKSM